jgi:hypothetical protein
MSAGTLIEKYTAAPSGRSSSGATAQPWSDGPTEKKASRSTAAPIMPLRCAAQNYAWGRPACESEVAGLVEASGEALDAGARYAELWMGTHPSAPSTLRDGSSLREWVRANPTEAMGEKVCKHTFLIAPYYLLFARTLCYAMLRPPMSRRLPLFWCNWCCAVL